MDVIARFRSDPSVVFAVVFLQRLYLATDNENPLYRCEGIIRFFLFTRYLASRIKTAENLPCLNSIDGNNGNEGYKALKLKR
jgi:hypothetical protein